MRVCFMRCLRPFVTQMKTVTCGRARLRSSEARQALVCGVIALFSASASADEKSLEELMPRISSMSPAEGVKSFQLQQGFSVELVASEPDVTDPIDAAFDEQGRMFVVEMNDYPFLPEQRVQKYKDQRPETWGRIRLLTDTDGDGRMDKSVVFADRLRWPQSVCCSRGGVYLIAPPHLLFLKDTDGDDVGDQTEIICSGFNSTNVQGLANGLEWGRDNAIYFSAGISGGELTVPARANNPEYKFTPGRRDLRLDPVTNQLSMVAGGQQFGHTIDDWGDRFICSNSNHIVHATWPLNYLERNPLLSISDPTRSIAKEGAAAVVYRASPAEPWRVVRTARRAADPEMQKKLPATELVPTGFFTSATGVTVYRGGAYPPEFRGNVFIGDCGSNLVHRKTLTPAGISYLAERADPGVEFLTSTDNWFRPVNFVNAPDGTLYILDMYRETIEHPFSIPDDIKVLVDLESGHDRGRIWRLMAPGTQRISPPNLQQQTTKQLVTLLNSPHGWIRDTAQRLLVEQQDQAAVPILRNLATAKTQSVTRLHALWTLHGLGALQGVSVQAALADPNPHLRELGLRLLPGQIAATSELARSLVELRHDPSERVVWQLAFTLGDLPAEYAVPGLRELARTAASQPDLRMAWLSSVYSRLGTMTIELLAGETDPVRPLLGELARLIGSEVDPANCLRLLEAVIRPSVPDSTRTLMLLSLGEGLRRRGSTITKLLTTNPENTRVTAALAVIFERASHVSQDVSANDADRLSSVMLLALADAGFAERSLPDLLSPQTSPVLQQASIRSLTAHGTESATNLLLRSWKGFGPGTRREVVDNLVQSGSGALALITFIREGEIKPGEIERDKRQLLLNHPLIPVRDAAQLVLAEPPSDRKDIVTSYQPSLELTGDPVRGKLLYGKTCVQCHRAGTAGHQVGPDFVSVQNKSPADLLVAILDPNREAQPNYQTYTAVTRQAQIFTGIISAETTNSVTLKRAESKEDVILRDTLDELVSSGKSLMPEGLEKELDKQQLADLIAYIKTGK